MGDLVKKILISYLVISSLILSSLVIAFAVTNNSRKGFSLNNPGLIESYGYELYQDTELDYLLQKTADLSFNDSHEMNEINSVDFTNSFAGGYITVGSIKNQTEHKHGLLQLIEFDDTIMTDPEPFVSQVYLNTTIAETEYLTCRAINTSFDSSSQNPTVFALKEITNITKTFDIDILEIDVGHFSLNSTLVINSTLFGSLEQFVVFDVNGDGFFEIYIIGENATNTDNYLLVEYEYNLLNEEYELSHILEWNANDLEITAMDYIEESTTLNFIISGVNATLTESFVIGISIPKENSRSFTFQSNFHMNFGSDVFITYNMKLYRSNESANPGIVLFGTHISGADNYPSCVTVSYQSGTFGTPSLESLDVSPGWSFDGLISDIDMDDNDEIILTTYDLLSLSRSEYSIFSSNDLLEIDSGQPNTYRIKSCASLDLEYANIGSWLGYDSAGDHSIEFYLSQYIPISISANSYFLTKEILNEIQIETTDLLGNIRTRADFTVNAFLEAHPEINQSTTTVPNQITLNLTGLDEEITSDDIVIQVLKDGFVIDEHSFTIEFTVLPDFVVTFPAEPVVLRKEEDTTQIIQFTINNQLEFEIGVNVTIETDISESSNSNYFNVSSLSNSIYNLELELVDDYSEDTYTEIITITLVTNLGTYQFSTTLPVTTSFQILPGDLLNVLWIMLSIVVVLFIAFLFITYRVNKKSIRNQITNEEPLVMNLPWFKSKAIDNLIKEYSTTGNWEMGIKLSEEYLPERLELFHGYRARDLLLEGQNLAWEGKFFDTLTNWQKAKESLIVLKNEQWLDIINWILDPLSKIVDARKMKNKEKKAAALLNEFELLNGLSEQSRRIMGIELTIPLYFVAEDLGLSYKDSDDLQNSLTHLQYAYQYAPDFYKNRIIKEITQLIGMGVQPKEMVIPQAQEVIKDRIARRMIRCFSCGTEKAFGEDICPNCGVETVQCSVCKLPISFGVGTAECPHCENIAHREHLLEWIKVKGSCPVCQRHLKAADIKPSVSSEEE